VTALSYASNEVAMINPIQAILQYNTTEAKRRDFKLGKN